MVHVTARVLALVACAGLAKCSNPEPGAPPGEARYPDIASGYADTIMAAMERARAARDAAVGRPGPGGGTEPR